MAAKTKRPTTNCMARAGMRRLHMRVRRADNSRKVALTCPHNPQESTNFETRVSPATDASSSSCTTNLTSRNERRTAYKKRSCERVPRAQPRHIGLRSSVEIRSSDLLQIRMARCASKIRHNSTRSCARAPWHRTISFTMTDEHPP